MPRSMLDVGGDAQTEDQDAQKEASVPGTRRSGAGQSVGGVGQSVGGVGQTLDVGGSQLHQDKSDSMCLRHIELVGGESLERLAYLMRPR